MSAVSILELRSLTIPLVGLRVLTPLGPLRFLSTSPTIPFDLFLDEVQSLLLNAMHAQENVNTAFDSAVLQREAQIELQKETSEPFPTDDIHDPDAAASRDDVHLPPTSTEPHTPAATDVDDSATSVAPTEAVNPGYSMSPPPAKVPRTGTASEARKFLTGSVMKSDTSDSPTLIDDHIRAFRLALDPLPLRPLSLLGGLRMWCKMQRLQKNANKATTQQQQQQGAKAVHTTSATAAVPTPPPVPSGRASSRPPEPSGPPPGHFGLGEPDVRRLAPPKPAPTARDVAGRPEPKGKGKSKNKGKGKG